MGNDDRTGAAQSPHSLRLEERQRLLVTGVREVVSFDENEVSVKTEKGLLIVRGSGLKVDRLAKEAGELTITGLVTDLSYEEERTASGLWSRLFR